jgi:hypothetical protein
MLTVQVHITRGCNLFTCRLWRSSGPVPWESSCTSTAQPAPVGVHAVLQQQRDDRHAVVQRGPLQREVAQLIRRAQQAGVLLRGRTQLLIVPVRACRAHALPRPARCAAAAAGRQLQPAAGLHNLIATPWRLLHVLLCCARPETRSPACPPGTRRGRG